ncbi:MAG TPA: hypothetical protein VIS05_10385, partial [Ilumatobacter sp.]
MISCVYCNGAHERPADVRRCWADHGGADAPAASPESPAADPRVAGADVPPDTVPSAGSRAVVALRRGPPGLGRHVVVAAGQPAPGEWAAAERIRVDAAALADPAATATRLRTATAGVVIELAGDGEFDPPPAAAAARAPDE